MRLGRLERRNKILLAEEDSSIQLLFSAVNASERERDSQSLERATQSEAFIETVPNYLTGRGVQDRNAKMTTTADFEFPEPVFDNASAVICARATPEQPRQCNEWDQKCSPSCEHPIHFVFTSALSSSC